MTIQKATNITWHEGNIAREDRERLLQQKGAVLWFTGLSGSPAPIHGLVTSSDTHPWIIGSHRPACDLR